jgi:glycosyltransferase involved in cell wall biosynthesis
VSSEKTLLFFTAGFPYGIGETFIEAELPFLSKKFNKIFIIPVCDSPVAEDRRELPSNFELNRFENSARTTDKINCLLNFWFWKGFLSDFKRKRNTNILSFFKVNFYQASRAVNLFKQAEKLLKDHKDNNQYAAYSYWLNESAIACALLKKSGIAEIAISRCHGWDVYEERHKPDFLPFRKFLAENLNSICCISEQGHQYMQKNFKIPASQLSVFRLGTKKIALSPSVNERMTIVSCSSVIPLKRVGLIAEALSHVNIPITWIHFGDGPLFENLRQIVKKAEDTNSNLKVELKGSCANHAILEFYQSNTVDLFVNVSETEGLPVSMMEAMSAGIPVIGTDVGGVSEIVRDNFNGFLLPQNPSPEEVASKILYFHNLPKEEKLRLRKNAREHWEKNFNAEKNYTAFADFLAKASE